MIELSAEQQEHAERLHREALVFDYFPRSEPIVMTPEEERLTAEWLAAGDPSGTVIDRIFARRTREMERDPEEHERIASYWRETGVSVVALTLGGLDPRLSQREAVIRDIGRRLRRFQVADYLMQCLSADDFERAHQAGKLGVLFALQETDLIGSDLTFLDTLYDFGVRMIQLTYNSRNLWGDGCTERVQGGLTQLGVQAVKRLNELGIVVDLSHCGDGTTNDALAISERPVAFSHTGCRALYAHPRAKTDDQLRRLAERDGYVGIFGVPFFFSPDGSAGIETMLDHIEHAAGIVGVERVGIGTDWGAWSADVPGVLRDGVRAEFMRRGFREEHGLQFGVPFGTMTAYTEWREITAGLVSRGYRDSEIRGILGANYLAFFRRATQ
jgi:membrane dipeptidase